MKINRYDSGLLHSNMYRIEENGHAIIIDPCRNTQIASGLVIDYLIITHEHYDHISGVNDWKAQTNAPLLCSKACAGSIEDPRKNMSRYFDVFCSMQTWIPIEDTIAEAVEYSCRADAMFEDRMSFEWQGHKILLMEIPGHSPGSIGILIDDSDFFPGDSMLENTETELRFPGGSRKKWEKIGKPRIESIQEGTRIWPGHFDGYRLQKQ